MYIGLVATILLGTTPVNFDQVCSQANEFLAEMVAINTTNPPGNETPLLERVRAHLAKEKIPAEIFEGAPGRGNLLAHLKGNGTQKPILLMAHVDVVGVEVVVGIVDVDNQKELSRMFAVSSIPTTIAFQGGETVFKKTQQFCQLLRLFSNNDGFKKFE